MVKTNWPGASARDVEQQVTDKIERKLQEVPNVDWVRSYSQARRVAGVLRDQGFGAAGAGARDVVPGAQEDRRHPQQLPPGIQGPFFNDEFGDTYTNIYALVGDGFGYRELKDIRRHASARSCCACRAWPRSTSSASRKRRSSSSCRTRKLATLGVEPAQIIADARRAERRGARPACSRRRPTASTCARPARSIRVDAIRDIAIRANNRVFRLGDIAKVTRGYVDPPQQKMRWQGKEALGLGITMAKGGDVIELGHDLDARDRAHPGAAAGRRRARRR